MLYPFFSVRITFNPMFSRSNFTYKPRLIIKQYSATPFYKKPLFLISILILVLLLGFFLFNYCFATTLISQPVYGVYVIDPNNTGGLQGPYIAIADGTLEGMTSYVGEAMGGSPYPLEKISFGLYGDFGSGNTTCFTGARASYGGVSVSADMTQYYINGPELGAKGKHIILNNYYYTFALGYNSAETHNAYTDYRGQTNSMSVVFIKLSSNEIYPPVCDLENCDLCLTSDTCQNAGCVYEWISAYGYWDCHAPYIPYVSGCGMAEGCYGCQDQTACENAEPVGSCEWVDKGEGYGFACYPYLAPPAEITWVVPELENCDELSGVEKWLCLIKNFIAGAFMPTQEKVNNLKLTMDNFKTKFPFNYANSLSAFFTTIKTSVATEKSIPIKILGTESNVSFAFWEKTASIGGTTESFKNILFDFTTLLIIIAFAVWVISFIKRIF